MQENAFIKAKDVATELGVSTGYAYKLIREMNKELSDKGFLVVKGRTSKKYFNERVYGKGVR